jgi:hemerythrin-like domain-containing protein
MKPVDILSAEHRVIEIMLDCLQAMSERIHAGKGLDLSHGRQAVDFIRTFADQCHHGKEEDRLFPAMVRKGVPNENGPIGVMLFEHEQGRSFVKAMSAALDAFEAGEVGAADSFAFAAEAYVDLLRNHIAKEDSILFPMANRIMNDEEHASLLAQFDIVERDHMGQGTHERYLKLAETLGTAYGVDISALTTGHQQTGCGACHHQH